MKIAVYGANGYTGRLVVAELSRRGIGTVLVGRGLARLREAAAEAAAAEAETRVAGVDDTAALAGAFRGCDAVINCAGPFVASGEAVVRAAIRAGCHYVDIAGEQLYLKRIHDTFAAEAANAGVTVVPGVNDDGLPSDLIAHLAARRVAPVTELVIALDLTRGGAAPSRGTLRSALANLGTLTGGGLTFRDGDWLPDVPVRRTSVVFPCGPEPVPAARFPLPGVVTVPRHVPARYVEGVVGADLVAAFSAVTPELVDGLPDGPSEDARLGGRWTVVAEATGRDGRSARGVVSAPDTYGSTAVIAVESARRLVVDGAEPGVPAPAQAYDPTGFLDFLTGHGATWTLEVEPAGRDEAGAVPGGTGPPGTARVRSC
ncbi:saccharopine dehydrogenase NADP-binding domain-containing protein [Actinoallomurus oryzae]|uniref:Saccharopine dehydrogenase NADP-binding domain-containing protein n=1 Tax=Actinoallomurus oryzae TaxID=502180 RepID=A0ABP8QMD6_9ACTN